MPLQTNHLLKPPDIYIFEIFKRYTSRINEFREVYRHLNLCEKACAPRVSATHSVLTSDSLAAAIMRLSTRSPFKPSHHNGRLRSNQPSCPHRNIWTLPLTYSQKENLAKACADIARELISAHEQNQSVNLNALKSRSAKKFKLGSQPRLVDIIAAIPDQWKKYLLPKLKAKPVRTASGVITHKNPIYPLFRWHDFVLSLWASVRGSCWLVLVEIAVVAVMSKPHRCPHIAMTGNICVYCPGGPDSDFEYSTQSYTGYEPTSMRAIRARYDPYEQARGRIDQLRVLGHNVDKVPTPSSQILKPCSYFSVLYSNSNVRLNTLSWAERSCLSPIPTVIPS